MVLVVATLPTCRNQHFTHFMYTNKTCQTFFYEFQQKKRSTQRKGGVEKDSVGVLGLHITTLTNHWKHFIISQIFRETS